MYRLIEESSSTVRQHGAHTNVKMGRKDKSRALSELAPNGNLSCLLATADSEMALQTHFLHEIGGNIGTVFYFHFVISKGSLAFEFVDLLSYLSFEQIPLNSGIFPNYLPLKGLLYCAFFPYRSEKDRSERFAPAYLPREPERSVGHLVRPQEWQQSNVVHEISNEFSANKYTLFRQ